MGDPTRYLERGPAAELWRHTLAQIPCIFGRLVYLSSLRDLNTGMYGHHGLALMFGEAEASRTLAQSHRQAFEAWLSFPLEHQKADLDLYLSTLAANKSTLATTWLRHAPYKNFIPEDTADHERVLYLTDLEALLGLLKNEYGASSRA